MKLYTTLGDGIDALKLADRPTPEAKAGEILVKINAVSLNYRDLLVINSKGNWKPDEPRIPVSDGAGEVVAVGAGVTKWKTGDRVAGIFLPHWIDGELTAEGIKNSLGGAAADGVMSEYAVFNENAVVAIPEGLSFEEAATLPCAPVTAWHAVVHRSRVKSGDTVVIQGTGGVSLSVLQFAHALGAKVIATSSSDEKLARVKELGADATINYKQTPDWDKQVLEITGGLGADHVFEMVGGAGLNQSLNALRMGGTISIIGLLGGGVGEVNTIKFFSKNANVYGVEVGSREMFEEMNRFIEANNIKPVVDKVFEFAEFKEALKYLESGSHFGKVVVRLS